MCLKYLSWIEQQDKEFIKEVVGNNPLTNKFKDYNYKAITLKELEELDNRFINNPEGKQ